MWACLSPLAVEALGEEPFWTAKPGPWGELQVRVVYLEPSDTLLAAVAKPNAVPRWVFEQTTESAVRADLQRCGLSSVLIDRLLNPASRDISGNVVSLFPTVEEVASLSVPVRSALYLELARSSANEYQRDPFLMLGSDLDDWLAGSGFNEAQTKLFRGLLWQRGDVIAFSDIEVLLTLAKNPTEVRNTFRGLTRVRSLLVELKLPLKGDRRAFLDYWSAQQPDSQQLTFLRAVTQRRAEQTVDITHFLPAFARQRIYTYPDMSLRAKGYFPDCHWTALNFFNLEPDNQYLDMSKAAARLMNGYAAIDPPYTFGDVLCFMERGEGIHSCVYIADDIVMTKNGDSIMAPWVLMQLKDVENIYRGSSATRIQGFRLKR